MVATPTRLGSFPEGFRACVFGASGGIGGALTRLLTQSGSVLHAGARKADLRLAGVTSFAFDLEDEASIKAACARVSEGGPLHLVIVATGLLHEPGAIAPEKTWRALDAAAMTRAFAVNTIGPALIGKHLLDHLAQGEKSVFAVLSARVGSIADNRLGGWHAYRASKAALNMTIQNFAIELARRNPDACAVALHPGTVDTGLSRPFQAGVPAQKLFSPEQSARALLDVIDGLTPQHSGKLIAWNGDEISY